MIDPNTPFRLFASCILIKGISRSTICDLNRNYVHLIPNSLYQLLVDYQSKSLQEVKDAYDVNDNETIDEYFEFLAENELIFFDDNLELFPQLNMQWHSATQINSSIIDLNAESDYSLEKLAKELDFLGCAQLEIRLYDSFPIAKLNKILSEFSQTTISSISVLAAFHQHISEQDWIAFCNNHPAVCGLTIHGSPNDRGLNTTGTGVVIQFVSKVIKNETCCGVINSDYFTSYIETFTESLQFNSCLNRKISIDRKGDIKNCPSMKEHFGNIKDTTLIEALSQLGFKKYWDIIKDQIHKCKDCEFRYVCTDCRAYVENPEDIYSAPVKCGYSPYTCVWEEWSTNPLKAKAIAFYKL